MSASGTVLGAVLCEGQPSLQALMVERDPPLTEKQALEAETTPICAICFGRGLTRFSRMFCWTCNGTGRKQ